MINILYLSAQNLEFNANCKLAYQSIFKLKLNEGIQLLEKEKKNNASNYMPYFIENYADFLKLFVNDNKALYNSIAPKVEKRLSKLKSAKANSPYYLYTQADMHLQWAFCKLKFGDNISAIFEIKKAHSMLQENQKKYPEFKPNIKSLGLLHTIFGAIPDKYKFGAKLLGFKGTIEVGLKELNSVLQDENFQFKEETIILYTLLLLHLKKDETNAWNMIDKTEITLGDNLLNYFIAATVASHTGKNDQVISILSDKPSGNEYYSFPFLDFLLGSAKLNALDESADVSLQKFITQNKGRSYQKEAYRKLAWYYLMKGDVALYKKNMQEILLLKDAPTDEDKSAQKEAEKKIIPNKELLKARVLFDGNQYEKALTIMQNISINQLTRTFDKVEYYYRKARILDELNKDTDAIKNYLIAIQKGEQIDSYLAANACIKIAQIFEKSKKPNNAVLYYKKALTLVKDEYADSIDAEAKAGLNRLGK